MAIRFFESSFSIQVPLWQYMMALSVMMSIPVLIIYFLAQNSSTVNNIGGVKG